MEGSRPRRNNVIVRIERFGDLQIDAGLARQLSFNATGRSERRSLFGHKLTALPFHLLPAGAFDLTEPSHQLLKV